MKRIICIIFLLSLTLSSCGPTDTSGCPDRTCSDYTTQAQAQVDFDADPDCLGELDNDNDGIACEHLSGGSTGCPTTSNCGCSGKTKAQCGGSCCRWIVGTGCRCN